MYIDIEDKDVMENLTKDGVLEEIEMARKAGLDFETVVQKNRTLYSMVNGNMAVTFTDYGDEYDFVFDLVVFIDGKAFPLGMSLFAESFLGTELEGAERDIYRNKIIWAGAINFIHGMFNEELDIGKLTKQKRSKLKKYPAIIYPEIMERKMIYTRMLFASRVPITIKNAKQQGDFRILSIDEIQGIRKIIL